MKFRSLWSVALVAAALVPAVAFAQEDTPQVLAIGSPAPMADVKMKSVDGNEFTITEAAGKKGTLVVFTCNHCPYAKAWENRIAAIGNAAKKRGIGVIAINANDPEAYPEDAFDGMVTRAKKLAITYPYVVDATSDVARAFGAVRTPEVYLFDAKGKLVYHGAVDDNAQTPTAVKQPYLRQAVDAVVAGKTVKMAETKSVG